MLITLACESARILCYAFALAGVLSAEVSANFVHAPADIPRAVVSSALCDRLGRSAVVAPPAASLLVGLLAEAQADPNVRASFEKEFEASSALSGVKAFAILEGAELPTSLVESWKTRYHATILQHAGDLSARAGFDASSLLPRASRPRLLLAATQYANERWSQPFPVSGTRVRKFYSHDRQKRLRFMSGARDVGIAQSNGIELGSLSYTSGNRLIFTVTPNIDSCRVAEQLATTKFDGVAWTNTPASIMMPEFKVETTIDLLPVIGRVAPQLLVPSALTIPLSVVASKEIASFSLGKNGTLGTAVSYAELELDYRAMPKPRPKRIIILDHPFAYALVDRGGRVLFVGTFR